MTFAEFQRILYSDQSKINHQDQCRLLDENMVIYHLLKSCFSSNMNISIHENDSGFFYRISPNGDYDISYLMSCYNDIRVTLYSHNYFVNVWMDGRDICIKLNDQ
nr:MAG TPA: hypothetical protein [Caudoviricetes sp.]